MYRAMILCFNYYVLLFLRFVLRFVVVCSAKLSLFVAVVKPLGPLYTVVLIDISQWLRASFFSLWSGFCSGAGFFGGRPGWPAVGLAGDPGGPGPWSAGSPWFGSWSAGLVGPVPGPVGGLSVAVIIMVWRSWGLAGVPGSWVGGPGRSVRILVLAPGILVGRPGAARPGFAGIAGSPGRSGHLPIPFIIGC